VLVLFPLVDTSVDFWQRSLAVRFDDFLITMVFTETDVFVLFPFELV
jgi:hypothetical protein